MAMMSIRPGVAALAVVGLALAVGPAATQSPPAPQQKPPVFRSGVDLMQLDVTVRDRDGQPVRGLTQADFTLLEDNAPQKIQGFTAVDIPDEVVEGSVWARTVARDVVTNEIDNQRIFVLVLDDALGMGVMAGLGRNLGRGLDPREHGPTDPKSVQNFRETAALFLSRLQPQDMAAVVFTGYAHLSQGLTTDHARLAKAIDSYPALDQTLYLDPGIPLPEVKPIPQCLGHKQVVRMVNGVVDNLASLPDRRKAIVYFGGVLPWAAHPTANECGTYWMWQDVFQAAQQGHVTINPIDTMGLRYPPGFEQRYITVAENTGGHAIVLTNDFEPGVRRIFLENSSYYLLAYQPTNSAADGRFRRLTVKVNRPDAEVTTRRSYWAPREPRPSDVVKEPPPKEVEALSGLIPLSDLKLRLAAAPFAVPESDRAVLALTVGVRQPPLASRTAEAVELLIRAFTVTGDARGNETQVVPITLPAARGEQTESRYEVLARVEVPKADSYHVRVSAKSDVSGTTGSVYTDVDVPDFRRERLSLSGAVVSVLPSGPVAPSWLLTDLMPFAPSTARAFTAGQVVSMFVRVYQGGNSRLETVTMKATIQDAAGTTVFEQTSTLAPDRFGEARAADHQQRVPLDKLAKGEYLLTLTAAAGRNTARRDVTFEVR